MMEKLRADNYLASRFRGAGPATRPIRAHAMRGRGHPPKHA